MLVQIIKGYIDGEAWRKAVVKAFEELISVGGRVKWLNICVSDKLSPESPSSSFTDSRFYTWICLMPDNLLV